MESPDSRDYLCAGENLGYMCVGTSSMVKRPDSLHARQTTSSYCNAVLCSEKAVICIVSVYDHICNQLKNHATCPRIYVQQP
jgi:hypothetical protein